MPKDSRKSHKKAEHPDKKQQGSRKGGGANDAHGPGQFEQLLLGFRDHAIKGIEQWCIAQGEVPHPRMKDAWDIFLGSMLQCSSFDPDCDISEATEVDEEAHEAHLSQALSCRSPEDQAALGEALTQLQRFADSLEDPEEWLGRMGMLDELK